MCYFITLVLPAGTDAKALAIVAKAHGRPLKPMPNGSLAAQLPPGAVLLSSTHGMCDCGTALGSARRHREQIAKRANPRRLKRKGWSEARIVRWLEETQRDPGLSPDGEPWAAYLCGLLAGGGARSVGVLLHWYRGTTDGETIPLKRRQRVPAAELTPEALVEIEEDVLYEFVSG